MKTKVDFIVPAFLPPFWGGTETVLRAVNEYYTHNDLNDLDVRMVVPFNSREGYIFDKQGSQHIVGPKIFKSKKLVKLTGLLFLAWYFVTTKADKVVIISPNIIDLAKRFSKINPRYDIVSWVHFSLANRFTDRAETFLKADQHLAISTGIGKQLQKFGVSESKIQIVYNPIEPKSKVVVKPDIPTFVYVGRFQLGLQKNMRELISALEIVNQKVTKPWKFRMFGNGIDFDAIKQLIYEKGLSEHIVLEGWSNDPWAEIQSATALVMTSTYEGLPMASLESLSYGVPVISSDVPTGPEDEINDKNGILYTLGNVEELATTIINFIDDNYDFNHHEVPMTINKFYTDSYFEFLTQVLRNG